LGLFDKIFPKKETKELSYLRFMNGYTPTFTKWNSNAYESEIVRSVIHCIASNGAKFKGKHIKHTDGKLIQTESKLNRLLQYKWNPIMNSYAALYKVISELFDPNSNNALIYINTDGFGNIIGLYPLNFGSCEFLEDAEANLYVRYQFDNGERVTVPYEKIAHLRMYYKENDVFGSTSVGSLKPTLELINTSNEGIINAVKSSAFLRGILKFNGILKKEDIKNERDRFVTEYLSTENNGGVGALDSKADFIKTELSPKMVDAEQIKLIEHRVYKFFNINENIVMSKYTEDEWNAFYESILEPIAIQLSLEFTNKFFTEKEKGFGNEIVFEANRLQYVSAKTKIQLIEKTAPFGILTINEAREIFNLSPIEGGDKRILAVGGEAKLIDEKEGEDDADKNNQE
jgi:HK97 family phage portal protein